MKRTRLYGFKRQSPVAVEVQANGKRETADIEKWGLTEGGQVSIQLTRSDLRVAPEGIYFEAHATGFDAQEPAPGRVYDPRMHELHYVWDFGDPGAVFQRPRNVYPEWRDANTSYGPKVAHTFRNPGIYDVTVTATEPSSGKEAVATVQVVVEDPDAVFSGARTIYISPTSNWTHAPTGCVQLNTYAQAVSAHSDSVVPRRFLFERGANHSVELHVLGDRHANAFLAPGGGPGGRPALIHNGSDFRGFLETNWHSTEIPGAARDVVVTGLDLVGTYDAETGEGRSVIGIVTYGDKNGYMMFDDIDARGFYQTVFNRDTPDSPSMHVFSNSTITDWKGYAIYESRTWKTAFLGMSIVQNPKSISGHNRDFNWYHGPYRGAQGNGLVIDGCEFFSNVGWFVNLHPYRTQQPCIRFNQNAEPNGFMNLQRSSCEGGYEVVAISAATGNYVGNAQNVILDKVLLIGSHMTHFPIKVQMGGVTIRNVLAIMPDTPRLQGPTFNFDPRTFVHFSDPMGSPNKTGEDLAKVELSRSEPIRVYNNTFINLMSPGNMQNPARYLDYGEGLIVNANFSDALIENNVIYEPNMQTTRTEDGPLHRTPVLEMLPRDRGYQHVGQFVEGVLGTDVTDQTTVTLDFPVGFTEADFGEGPDTVHSIRLGPSISALGGDADAAFTITPSGCSVENRTGSTWPAGHAYRLFIDHRNGGTLPPQEENLATPTDILATYAPTGGSPVLGDALNGTTAVDDLRGRVRPVYPSRGASEFHG